MRSVIKIAVGLTFAMLIMTGCRTAPVVDIHNATVKSGVSADQVRNAIFNASKKYGWSINEVSGGNIEANIQVRSHQASVLISYSNKYYSIKYMNSENLKYNSSRHSIHNGYNGWILNLRREIDREIMSAGFQISHSSEHRINNSAKSEETILKTKLKNTSSSNELTDEW